MPNRIGKWWYNNSTTLLNFDIMVVTIKKGEGKKQITAAVKRLEKKAHKASFADFYGKLKDELGDGLVYQKKMRNDWD